MVEVSKLNTLTGHTDCIYTVGKGESNHLFYSGAGDGMVVQWNLENPENGQLIAKVPNSIYALCLSQDGEKMILGHNYDGIHIVNIAERKEISSLKLTAAAIFDIQIYGQKCFVATGDGELVVVSLEKIETPVIERRIKATDKSARCISIHPSGKNLAVGYSDHQVRVFDMATFDVQHTLSAHTNSVFTVRYSPSGEHLFTAGRDAHLKIWTTDTYQLVESIVAHMYAINHIDFSPNGKHFVTCSMDKSIKIWDMQTFRLLKVIDKARHAGHGTSVNKLFWSNFTNQLVSASDDRTLSLWDIKVK